MRLAETRKLVQLWRYANKQGSNVVLMRHAPKAGSEGSDLSKNGKRLAAKYGDIIALAHDVERDDKPVVFVCTSKKRTRQTLKLLFTSSHPKTYLHPPDLDTVNITPFIQDQVNAFHKTTGRWRGYYLNHTYYFLEQLGGKFDAENHAAIGTRIAWGIRSLFLFDRTVVYCGHSPAIETGLEKLLGKSLAELGGFLNPLDSIHLRISEDTIEWVARINPIVDYVDLESETYFDDNT